MTSKRIPNQKDLDSSPAILLREKAKEFMALK